MNMQRLSEARPWHALPAAQVAQELNTDTASGLTTNDAASRLSTHGPNRLAEKPSRPAWLKFLDQFRNFLVIVLLGAAGVALLLTPHAWPRLDVWLKKDL